MNTPEPDLLIPVGKHMVAQPTIAGQYEIFSKHGVLPGTVVWCSGWRCYVFQPSPVTEYSPDCLRALADMLDSAKDARV